VIDTHTIQLEQKSKVVSSMDWSFDKTYASKADLIMFDILANNDWKRPIYFATSVSEETYMGLDQYLHLEGYAYRLLPLKNEGKEINKTQRTNTDVMYMNVMNRLDFTAFHGAKYLDAESRRIVNSTWQLNNTLVNNLILEGKTDKANQVIQKSMRELPLRNYSIVDTLGKLHTVQNLYVLNQIDEANQLANATSDFLIKELQYIATLAPSHQLAYREDVQLGLYVLDEFERMTAVYLQEELNQKIEGVLNRMLKSFHIEG
jgi:hypothetical protein